MMVGVGNRWLVIGGFTYVLFSSLFITYLLARIASMQAVQLKPDGLGTPPPVNLDPELIKTLHKKMHIALITLDTTRHDSTLTASAKNFKSILQKYTGNPEFKRAYTHGTYTLPAHMSMLLFGSMPSNRLAEAENSPEKTANNFFRLKPWTEHDEILYPLPLESPNIPKGFEYIGYRTMGIGGTRWFDIYQPTASFWKGQFFQEFNFYETGNKLDSNVVLPIQLEGLKNFTMKETFEKDGRYNFIFFNIREMHGPYYAGRMMCKTEHGLRHRYCGALNGTFPNRGLQAACFDYVDQFIPDILLELPKPVHVIIVGDHGECFPDEDKGIWGHAFYHPKIMEVPFAHFILKDYEEDVFLKSLVQEKTKFD